MNPMPATDPARWVLLRGLTRESGHWGDFPARLQTALQATAPHAEVHSLDLPGNGRLHREPSPCTVAAMTQSARQQLRARGLAPPYHVLAMSLGAMVAADWASRHPEELAAAVLINTSLRPFSPWWRRLQPARLPILLGLLLPGRSIRAREAAVLRLTSRLTAPAPVLDEWVALNRRHPVSAANAMRQLLAAARFCAAAEAPSVPMLVLVSRRDALVDPACSQALARRWALPLQAHPEAGHDLPLDDAAWVVAQVLRLTRKRCTGHQ
jgi:pimeloyl-ACP methyl ester carboxylesterase